MMNWQVVLPHIGPAWNLDACLESAGKIEVPFLIVDNSPGGDTAKRQLPGSIEVERHPENLGIAASWNAGLRRGADRTMLLSASIRFLRGLRAAIQHADEYANQWGLQFSSWPHRREGPWNIGWKAIVIGRALVDLIGYPDENFWPGYNEDNDYGYRAMQGCETRTWPVALGDSTDAGLVKAGDGIAVRSGLGFPPGVAPSGDGINEYYRQKWGGLPSQEKFIRPFNDETKDLKWWPTPPRRA